MKNLNVNRARPDIETPEREARNLRVNATPTSAPIGQPAEHDAHTSPLVLMSEIARLVNDNVRSENVFPYNMQKSCRLLLTELSIKDARTQLELARATKLKAPTISVALQKMESDGMVVRKPDPHDLRAMRVYLTDKGRSVDKMLFVKMTENEKLITEDLTEYEYTQLLSILRKLYNKTLAVSGDGDKNASYDDSDL